ncbi:hypothetical protein V8E36_007711 [Tilletia maclaganii]
MPTADDLNERRRGSVASSIASSPNLLLKRYHPASEKGATPRQRGDLETYAQQTLGSDCSEQGDDPEHSSPSPNWVWSIKTGSGERAQLCTTESGYIELPEHDREGGGGKPPPKLRQRFAASLADLSARVHPEQIYFLQISDAYRPSSTGAARASEIKSRKDWSDAFRPPPFVSPPPPKGPGGGKTRQPEPYLPVLDVFNAILATGYRGPCTIEVFDDIRPRPAFERSSSSTTEEEEGEGQEQKVEKEERWRSALVEEAQQAMAGWQQLCSQASSSSSS